MDRKAGLIIGALAAAVAVAAGRDDPTLVRVVLWTDWGVPTLAFDVYLVGFDVQPINVRAIFAGNVPSTGEGADLSGFPFCDLLPPSHPNPVLTADERGQLAADHTGQPIERIHTDTDRDFVMEAEEALEYGIIDRVISSREAVDRTGPIR